MVDNYYKNSWKSRTDELADKDLLKNEQAANLKEMIDSPDKENLVLAKELIRLKITEALVEGLNQGQLNAFLSIVDFFRDPVEDALVLKGYAGTGKTFLVKRIIEYITTSYPNRKVAITAPTNKAVHVLTRNSPFADKSAVFEEYNEPDEQIVYSTIHKLLGLKEEITPEGEQKFVVGKKTDINNYKYIIVDEVSMLNDDLFTKLMQFKKNIRFIFMGDPAQIPPINKEHCMPFQEDCPYSLRKIELTEIMRQKGDHPIIEASMTLRENLKLSTPLGTADQIGKLNAVGHGIIRINAVTERPKIRELINQYFKDPQYEENADFIKIIAWRNKTVTLMNDIVRQCLYGEDKQDWNVGDRIVANKPLFKRIQNGWGNEYKIKANTSEEFIITNVSKVYREFQNEKFKTSPKINFDGNFWELTVKRETNTNEDYYTDALTKIYVIHPSSFRDYKELLDEMKQLAKRAYNPDFWVMYFNMVKWSDDVLHNYAITAHKAQGSTYDNVILLEEDLNFNKKIVERNRIKYTAYTRAKERMYTLI